VVVVVVVVAAAAAMVVVVKDVIIVRSQPIRKAAHLSTNNVKNIWYPRYLQTYWVSLRGWTGLKQRSVRHGS